MDLYLLCVFFVYRKISVRVPFKVKVTQKNEDRRKITVV